MQFVNIRVLAQHFLWARGSHLDGVEDSAGARETRSLFATLAFVLTLVIVLFHIFGYYRGDGTLSDNAQKEEEEEEEDEDAEQRRVIEQYRDLLREKGVELPAMDGWIYPHGDGRPSPPSTPKRARGREDKVVGARNLYGGERRDLRRHGNDCDCLDCDDFIITYRGQFDPERPTPGSERLSHLRRA